MNTERKMTVLTAVLVLTWITILVIWRNEPLDWWPAVALISFSIFGIVAWTVYKWS